MDGQSIEVDRAADGAVVVSLRGEHDLATAHGITEQVEAALEDARVLVVDLGAATFLDSTALASLVRARDAARRGGVGFAVAIGPDGAPGVRRILDVTGLGPALPVLESREDALASAGGAAG